MNDKPDKVDEFLRSVSGSEKHPEVKLDMKDPLTKWQELVLPETVSIILGRKGFGKSALAYWLCDEKATKYNLHRVVINLPRERQQLLPSNFEIRTLADIPRISNAAIIIDEGTTMLPAGGKKLEELVKGFVALSRQRNQLILFIFHASSDVGSRILRGMDYILLKEPSQRQIQHGSKDAWWHGLLTEAKERFEALADTGANPKEYTFIDSEEPEFRGVLPNPLPKFWSDELSKAWAGVDNVGAGGYNLATPKPPELSTEDRLTKFGLSPEEFNQAIEIDRELNLEQLREKCRTLGLPTSGEKKRLIANLLQYWKEHDGKDEPTQ